MQTHAAGLSSRNDPSLPELLRADDAAASAPAIHVIDDDESFRRSLLRILQALGYQAVGYGCAGEFLLALRGEPSGCILLDITMPGPSGIELLRALTQRGSVPPTIFVTARDDVMTSVNAMKMGAFDYLVKPTSAERTIFAGVAAHRLNKQMAGDLGACERTVKALRARMMAKLNVTTVPELVRAAALLEGAGVTLETAECATSRSNGWRASILQRALPAGS